MADTLKQSFDETQGFTNVVFQRGRHVLDFELNEAQDIARVRMYRGLRAGLQTSLAPGDKNPASSDNGYKVVGTGAVNTVTIKAGTLLCDGYPLYLATDWVFSSCPAPPGSGTRTDVLYLSVTESEVPDPSQVAQLGETTLRKQLVIMAVVSTTGLGGVPSSTLADIWQGGVHYFPLASILRTTGVTTIAAGDVTDLRTLLPAATLSQITRQTNSTVASLVATSIETPDGSVLPESAYQSFDIDPAGTQSATARGWSWTLQKNTTPKQLLAVHEVSPGPGSGVTAVVLAGAATAYSVASGPLQFTDANTLGAPSGSRVAPLSGTSYAHDKALLVAEKASSGTAPTTPSLLRQINARGMVTVGDGTKSFGDFTGPDAIQRALAWIGTTSMHTATIFVKEGAYQVNATYGALLVPAGYTIRVVGSGGIEGTSQSCITADTTAPGYIFGVSGALYLEGLQLTGPGGATLCYAVNTLTYGTSVFAAHCGFTATQFRFASATRVGFSDCVLADLNAYTSGTTLTPLLGVEHTSGTPLGEYLFLRCALTPMRVNSGTPNGAPLCRVQVNTSTAGRIARIRFEACRVTLYASRISVGPLTTALNSGVFVTDPNGYISGTPLTLDRVEFLDCEVASNTFFDANANATLLSVSGYQPGDSSQTQGYIPTVHFVVRGGSWKAAYSPTSTSYQTFSPFCISTKTGHVVVENASFGWTGAVSTTAYHPNGLAPTEAMQGLAGAAIASGSREEIGPNAFFSVGGKRVLVRDCHFSGFASQSTTLDAWVYSSGAGSAFEHCLFDGYVLGYTGAATAPVARVAVGTSGGVLATSSAVASALLVKDVHLAGTASVDAFRDWISKPGSNGVEAVLFGVAPLAADTTSGVGSGGITFEDCGVHGFTATSGSTASDSCAFGLLHLSSVGATSFSRLVFRRCHMSGAGYGLGVTFDSSGTAVHTVTHLCVVDCVFESEKWGSVDASLFAGIRLHNVLFRDTKLRGNTVSGTLGGAGIHFVAPYKETLFLTDNNIRDTSGTQADGILLQPTVTGADEGYALPLVATGNACINAAPGSHTFPINFHVIETLSGSTPVALASTRDTSVDTGAPNHWTLATGIASGVASFTSTRAMLFNNAILLTP